MRSHYGKTRLATQIVRVGRIVGFLRAYGFLRSYVVKNQIVIIRYHRVDTAQNYPWSLASLTPTTPQDFDREIRYLYNKYKIISLDELSTALRKFETLPCKTAVITIDDGYKDVFLNVYPILRRYNVPATIFLATGYIGTGVLFWWDKVGYVLWHTKLKTLELGDLGNYSLGVVENRLTAARAITNRLAVLPEHKKGEMINQLVKVSGVDIPRNIASELILSWDEIKEMSRNQVYFGAHTVSHPILSKISLESAKSEILESKRKIEGEVGREVVTFCYPDGRLDDVNDDIEEILESSGFKCAVTTSPQAFVSSRSKPYELPRISGEPNFDIFELFVSGVYLDSFAKLSRIKKDRHK